MCLNVLIIEDESIVALHIKKTIESLEHEVVKVVKNSEDALKAAKNHKIDLVISDIKIQGRTDGIECCTELQKAYGLAVVFITAFRDVQTLQRASKLNFIGYLIKPFREDELETMVELAILKSDLLSKKENYIINDKYKYNYNNATLYIYNTPVKLTKNEHTLLLTLIKANGSVVTYYTLECDVWGTKAVEESTRRKLIQRFKQKVPDFPLTLVKKVGFKLDTVP